MCHKFAKCKTNYKLVEMGNKHAYIEPCQTAKFWTFSKFHETWLKRWSRPILLCGKFAKPNNNYNLVEKGNKLVLIKLCKTTKLWTFSEFHETFFFLVKVSFIK